MWSRSFLPDGYRYPTKEPAEGLEDAVEAFDRGDPVLIHDGDDRENEIDIVCPAHAVAPSDVARLRSDAGGLICVALSHDVAEAFGLPFLHDVVNHAAGDSVNIEYDDRPSFSLTVNHRETFTGVVDNDRARTIAALGEAAREPDATDFGETFDAPGHVQLLRAAPELLDDRRGHTELGIALAELASVPPAVVVCEMLDGETGGALSRSSGASYASDNDLVFLKGSTIVDAVGGD